MTISRIGNLDCVVELVENKCNLNWKDNSGKNAMLYAFENSYLDVVKVRYLYKFTITLRSCMYMTHIYIYL
jgi:hypothetical protein